MTTAAPARMEAVDSWKAAAIAGVVWIHCAFLIPHSPALLGWVSVVARFCVPVFILFWACFAERATSKPGWTWRKHFSRSGDLLVPFVFWSLLYWAIRGDTSGGAFHQISRYWSGYGWSGQYFFVLLVQLVIVFPLLRKVADIVPPRWNLGLAILLLVAAEAFARPSRPFVLLGDRLFPYWIPYAVCGIHLARGRSVVERLSWKWVVPCLALAPVELTWFGGRVLAIGPYFLVSILLATFVIGTSALQGSEPGMFKRPAARAVASWLSRNSMGIFCANPLLVVGFEHLAPSLPSFTFPGAGIALPLVGWIMGLAVAGGAILVLRKLGLARVVRN